MTHYNNINVKLSDSQVDKLKLTTKTEIGVTLRLSLNMTGATRAGTPNSNDEANFHINYD